MQDLLDGDHQGSPAGSAEDAQWVLEGPNLVSVVRFGRHRVHPTKRDLDGLPWWHFQIEYLEWSTPAARALLCRSTDVSQLLAPNYYLLNGRHRPTWHTRPGIDDPELAYIPWPPADAVPALLMMRLVRSVRG
jgi:hypothetical protein